MLPKVDRLKSEAACRGPPDGRDQMAGIRKARLISTFSAIAGLTRPKSPTQAERARGFCGARGRASPAVMEKVLKVLSGLEPSVPRHRAVPNFRPKSTEISSPGALDPDSGRSRRPGSIREGPGARNGPLEAENGDLGLEGGGGRKLENPGGPSGPLWTPLDPPGPPMHLGP